MMAIVILLEERIGKNDDTVVDTLFDKLALIFIIIPMIPLMIFNLV